MSPRAGVPTRTETLDELRGRLGPMLTDGMDATHAAQARGLLDELLDQWAYEAGASELTASIYEILERELVASMKGVGPERRFDLLLAEVLDRRLRPVANATFALGQRVVDHTIGDEEARLRGRELLAQVEVLAAEVRSVSDPVRRAQLERPLQDAMLEALFAIERRAMSLRLERYRADRADAASPKPAPPNVRP